MQPETMRTYFAAGSTRDVDLRLSRLNTLKAAVERHTDEICSALHEDIGKSSFEAYAFEIAPVLQELESLQKHLRSWIRTKRVGSPLLFFRGKTEIVREPYGLVLIISPWNYPFLLMMMPLVSAVACGNVVLAKYSRRSPATGKILRQIISESFPEEWVCVTDSADLEKQYDYLFFTGGKTAGHTVYQAVARYGTPATLELGGKNPCILDTTADLRTAGARIAWAKCVNAGQTCVAPDYLLVHASIRDEIVASITDAVSRYYGETPAENNDYAAIISSDAYTRLERYCRPEVILRQCGRHNPAERKFAPTLITADPADPIMQEEIFGPVLPVISWQTETELNRLITDTPLALYLFSTDTAFCTRIADAHPSGGVCVNDCMLQAANPHAPFGGTGTSGFGAYHGMWSIDTFSRRRTIVLRKNHPEVSFRYPPYTEKKMRILQRWRRNLF